MSPDSGVPVPDAHSITAASTAIPAVTTAGGPTVYNPEIELSTDTDDSSSDMAAESGNKILENKISLEFNIQCNNYFFTSDIRGLGIKSWHLFFPLHI